MRSFKEAIMTRGLLLAGAVALIVGGCASSSDTERRAEAHDQRARQAASYEAYDTAAQEKREADRLHAKAARERSEELGPDEVVTPPPPPPGDYPPPRPPAEPLP
jgi:hypothetical protein